MFHVQPTYMLKLTVRLCLQFSSAPIWTSAYRARRVLLCWTSSPFSTLLAFALERISFFIFLIPIIRIPR